MRVRIGDSIGEITTLPGSSQIAVSHGVFLPPAKRGNGEGKKAHAKRLDMLRELGYDYALCTVVEANEAQVKILRHFGWTRLDGFKSSKTESDVAVYGISLQP